jgi:hypothetical protein
MNRDNFEAKRAIEAKNWLNHPDRLAENIADKAARNAADIKTGHSPKCTLTKCHFECKKARL